MSGQENSWYTRNSLLHDELQSDRAVIWKIIIPMSYSIIILVQDVASKFVSGFLHLLLLVICAPIFGLPVTLI